MSISLLNKYKSNQPNSFFSNISMADNNYVVSEKSKKIFFSKEELHMLSMVLHFNPISIFETLQLN